MSGGVDWSALGSLLALWLAVVYLPGPNILLLMQASLSRPLAHVLAAMAGLLTGTLTFTGLSAFGVHWLLETSPIVKLAAYGLGGIYLAWRGSVLVRAAWVSRDPANGRIDLDAFPKAALPAYRRGAATALSNAKSFALITSAFAASGVLLGGLATRLAGAGIIVATNLTAFLLLIALMRLDLAQRLYLSHMRGIEIAVGIVFVAFGLKLVVEALQVLV